MGASTCEACHAPIAARTREQKRPRARFCSRKCSGQFHRRTVQLKCATCGEVFESVPSRNRMYCGTECRDAKNGQTRAAVESASLRRCRECHGLYHADRVHECAGSERPRGFSAIALCQGG